VPVRLRGYRFEPLVLVLVALAALPPISLTGPQDRTRYELTRHLVLHHTLVLEPGLFDRAVFAGRTYSDKAPGMSFAAVPAYELERALGVAKAPVDWEAKGDPSLWLIHVLTSGVLFLVSVLVVGRLGERIVPGTGAATAAIFGVATLAGPLAPTFFEHDAAGAFAIAAFAFAWLGRRPRALVLAGLCAGTAVLFQYATGLIALALLAYCAWRHRRRALWFLAGAVPPALALGAYDWAAFGSPFHLSYRYVANVYAERQHHGFFGIGVPTLGGLKDVLVGTRGLLYFSPVLAAAAIGLWLLWRRGTRAEALLAAVVVVLFVLLDAGYFLVYGGGTPGPRFLAPALPLLALGLPCVLARWPRPTLLLAFASAVLTTVDALSWGVRPPDDTSWFPTRNEISKTIWAWAGLDRNVSALLVLACALAAVSVGAVAVVRR
jgi:Glycosyltransferase family 87